VADEHGAVVGECETDGVGDLLMGNLENRKVEGAV
jgi:hypothetical protein